MPVINTEGVRVAYMEGGAGEPVMALHSSAGSGAQWKALHKDLGDAFHLLAPDLCGYGDSGGWCGDGPLTLSAEGDRVSTIIDRLVEPVHLVGHSYGGAVALRLAVDKPHRIRSLTLIEPVAFQVLRQGSTRERELFGEISKIAGAVSEAVTSGDYEKGIRRFIDYWSGEGTWARIQADKKATMRRLTAKIALDFRAACTDPAKLDDYNHVRIPTLIMRGSRSPAPVQRITELLCAALPFARLETIHGAGHMAPITHADIVNPFIERHLQTHLGRYRRAA